MVLKTFDLKNYHLYFANKNGQPKLDYPSKFKESLHFRNQT